MVEIRDETKMKIDVSRIVLDTAQPRQGINTKRLASLAKDIKERGQLYPILVTPFLKKGDVIVFGSKALGMKDFKWWILDGEQRTRACTSLGYKQIDAIVRLELTFVQMLEIQFAANCKRAQITVEEMAKAVTRFKEEFLRENPKGDPIERLVELTGYSYSYFDMADAINRSDPRLKEAIYKTPKQVMTENNEDVDDETANKVLGGYVACEIEGATSDKNMQRGLVNVYVEEYKQGRILSALTPREIKPDLKDLEQRDMPSKDKEEIAEAILRRQLKRKRGTEGKDELSDFKVYKLEAERFYERVKEWNFDKVTPTQMGMLSCRIIAIVEYLKDEKKILGKTNNKKRK